MSQNRIALQFDVDRLNSLDAIITALEGQLTDLIGLSPDERRELDVPPVLSSTENWSPIPPDQEIGREEALFRRTDHWLSA